MSSVIFNPAGMAALLEGPLMRRELERVGDRVVNQAKANLGAVEYHPSSPSVPGGFPRWRTHDLANSVNRTEAFVATGVPTVLVYADAVHRGVEYGPILLTTWGRVFVDLALVRE